MAEEKSKMLEDSQGRKSSGRLVHVWGSFGFIAIWGASIMRTGEWIDPMGVAVACGVLAGGKAAQLYQENKRISDAQYAVMASERVAAGLEETVGS